jgi:hypothetical protein
MTSSNGAFTTGRDDGDSRRRNVQSYEKTNGGTVIKIEAEDTKKLQKVIINYFNPLRRQFYSPVTDSSTENFRLDLFP